jgi:AcrR family transcriptional regulator
MTTSRALRKNGEVPDLRDRKRLRTQASLYECAVELIAAKGYENVSVDEICQRAEVGRATFFRYFGTKAGLMIEFERRIAADIADRISAPDMSLEDKLDAVGRGIAGAWSGAHPNLRALGLDYLSSTAVRDMELIAAGITQITRAIFQSGLDSGELRTSATADFLASLYVTGMRMGVYHAFESGSRSIRADSTQVVRQIFLDGIRNREPGKA